ncbi:hypothetical protein FQR65_LT02394 [Abscondita terminalis]|nr:hypothetical protein FQR65_LT02394 [Abscondita terminalis]
MNSNVHILSDIYKEIETKVNNQLTSILQMQSDPEDILKKQNLEQVELDICSKFSALETQNETEPRNVEKQLKNLDVLLSSFIVDAREKNWQYLNKKLQECVLSADDEIFKKGLQIHFKIIMTPSVSPLGYLNLMETVEHFFTVFDAEKAHKRTAVVLRLLLKTQSELLRNTNPSKTKIVEKVIAHFIVMLNSHLDIVKTLSQLDVKACWFQKFTYSAPNRKVTLTYLKKTNLIDHFITIIIKHPYLGPELLHFPFKHLEMLTIDYFVIALLNRITNEVSLKQPLGNLLVSLFAKRPDLIVNSGVRKKFFEPLLTQNQELNVAIISNVHILTILNNISKIPKASKYLLESKSNKINRPQTLSIVEKHNTIEIVVNLTIMYVRNFINESEKEFFVDNNIFNLIDCCVNLLSTHVRVFTCLNLTKFVEILQDLYEIILNYNFNSDYYQTQVAKALCVLITLDYGVLKIVENRVLKEVVESVLVDQNTWCNLQLTLSHSTEGRVIVENCYHVVIKRLLINIWASEKNDEQFDKCSNSFFQVISNLNNFYVVRAMLQYENEGTVCGNQEKPVTLSELIENCLDPNYLGTVDVVLGLKCIQIFVTNLDLLVYLQHTYKLQECLVELQMKSNAKYCENNSNAMLIDECSWLRHYILLSIKYIGALDVDSNEKLLNQTKVIMAPYQSTFIPRTCNALQKFLHNYRNSLHDHNWVAQVRKSFRMSCKGKYKASVVLDLIEQLLKSSSSTVWPSGDVVLYGLFPEDYYGVTATVQYGIHNNLLHPSMQNDENLMMLLKQTRTFLGYRPEEFIGFDWLIAVIFLMSSGKIEKCKQPIMNIAVLSVAPVIWPLLTLAINNKKQNNYKIDIFYRQLEIILEDNTKINIALRSMDLSAKHIAEKWLRQCFFAVLDFKELCNFISLVVLYPSEYVLYYLVAMFEHCRDDIFTALQAVNSVQVLKVRILKINIFITKTSFYEEHSKAENLKTTEQTGPKKVKGVGNILL